MSSKWRNPRRPRGTDLGRQCLRRFHGPDRRRYGIDASSSITICSGFDLTGKMEFSSDPPIVDLIGAPHAKFRELVGDCSRNKSAAWRFMNIRAFRARHFICACPIPARPPSLCASQDLDGLLTAHASRRCQSDFGAWRSGSVQPHRSEHFCRGSERAEYRACSKAVSKSHLSAFKSTLGSAACSGVISVPAPISFRPAKWSPGRLTESTAANRPSLK